MTYHRHMAINPNPAAEPARGTGSVPEFSLGDRLRKAREFAGMDIQHLAEEIDIHRQSVARYENGTAQPKRHVLLSWSMVTGVDLRWIVYGPAQPEADEQTTSTTVLESGIDLEFPTRGIPRFRFPIKSPAD